MNACFANMFVFLLIEFWGPQKAEIVADSCSATLITPTMICISLWLRRWRLGVIQALFGFLPKTWTLWVRSLSFVFTSSLRVSVTVCLRSLSAEVSGVFLSKRLPSQGATNVLVPAVIRKSSGSRASFLQGIMILHLLSGVANLLVQWLSLAIIIIGCCAHCSYSIFRHCNQPTNTL